MRLSSVVLCVVTLGCCASDAEQRRPVPMPDSLATLRCEQVGPRNECALYGPSFVELLVTPARYHGKRIRIIGFVNFEFEGNSLCFHQEDWQRSIYRNCLWITAPMGFESDSAPSQRSPNQSYVLVEGRFDAANHGHMGMWSGAIVDVTRLQAWADLRVLPVPPPRR